MTRLSVTRIRPIHITARCFPVIASLFRCCRSARCG
jgi:hypothetical protein